MSAELYKSSDPSAWLRALASHDAALAAKGKPQLIALDRFVDVELPATLRERAAGAASSSSSSPSAAGEGAFLTGSELSRLMQWKMAHKFRPNLQKYVDGLEDAAVRAASRAAFAQLARGGAGSLRAASRALAAPLKGVGPALASLALAARDARAAAYMSDAALLAVCGSRDYSEAEFEQLSAALAAKAAALGGAWTANACQRALWAADAGAGAKAAAGAGAKAAAGVGAGAGSNLTGRKRVRD